MTKYLACARNNYGDSMTQSSKEIIEGLHALISFVHDFRIQPNNRERMNALDATIAHIKALEADNAELRAGNNVKLEPIPPIEPDYLRQVYIGHGVEWTIKDTLIHHSGRKYWVHRFCNTHHEERLDFPHMCVYSEIGKMGRYARPIRDMVGKFTLKQHEWSPELMEAAKGQS